MTLSVFRMFDLSGRALSAQRTRLDVVSNNLANAQTTRTPEGGPYRRQDVILSAENANFGFAQVLSDNLAEPTRTVRVAEIRDDPNPPKMVYNPDHPDANDQGYVAMPNVNSVEEMVNMITAMRGYQANLSVFNSFKTIADRALSLGRSS